MNNEKDYIYKMYDASLESEKAGIQQGYDHADAQRMIVALRACADLL